VQPSVTSNRPTAEAAPQPGVFLPRRRHYFVGCDLGQQNDATAISVIEKIDGVIDYNSAIARHGGYTDSDLPQKKVVRYDVRHLQRLPLKLSYPNQIERVKSLMARPPLCGSQTTASRAPN
jgi:hypothetical protein